MTALPAVTAPVLAEALDALPARLRRKVDDAVVRARGWPVTGTADGVTVRVDESTTVTLVAVDGVVRGAADARCSCLLAPNCLHRMAVLALAPVDDAAPAQPSPPSAVRPGDPSAVRPGDPSAVRPGDPSVGRPGGPAAGPVPGAPAGGTATPPADAVAARPADAAAAPPAGAAAAAGGGTPAPPAAGAASDGGLTDRQRVAAEGLWRVAVEVLAAGVVGCGVVLRTALLRAVHEARTNGLHRAAASGTRVAAGLRAAREAEPHHRLAELTDDLRELLAVSRRLRGAAPPADELGALLGVARRAYDPQAGLRLYGLCTVPVVTDSGYAGVVTYLADRTGRLWTVADLAPGDVGRAVGAGDATVAVGESGLSHRQLTRAGLVVSGGTASDSGQLGAGRAVRAVRAAGAGWADEPLAGLWTQPLPEQVRRAFDAVTLPVPERPAGADLLFLTVRVLGGHEHTVLVETGDRAVLTLTAADEHAVLPYRDNLRLLARAAGAELRLVGRLDPARRATVQALSVGPTSVDGPGLDLPESWAGHADLGFDRLHSSQLRAGDPGSVDGASPGRAGPVPGPRVGDAAGGLLRRQVERVVSGGRAVQALADPVAQRLRLARLDLGAQLLTTLGDAARARPRDAFGRLTDDDGQAFAESWLALAVYEGAASRALAEASWLP
ncbi:hypothetical protein [Micromonospora sp. WMMD714]|uniref:hypothetical protein n=1 Tax=Micromonospora sp. WMMD714 TaxID=3016097 RepID=UPI00249BED42|nr:hypothetical protein [Micromonospora sp. WMMD714]WFE65383.1 hypothetical protein O7625_19745 [Micromonospora sp. WMMD714]